MTLRLSFAAIVVPLLLVACGDSTKAPAALGGASSAGTSSTSAGASGGGATSSSGAAGTGVAGASAGVGGGGSGFSSGGRGGSTSASNGGSSAGMNFGGGGTSGAIGGSTSAAGSGGAGGGIPQGWITVDGIDYSMIPGPNFETVRYMFQGAPCSGSNCHFGGKNHLQVGKTADQLYSYMIGFTTLECGKLIDTANPSQSALVKYLRGPCGSIERMPQFKCVDDTDEPCVPASYIQAIEQWIANGAPR
ncbi:MAG: hypothetical protein ABW061_05775 [Polyangiaceae bacterium]